MVRVEIAEHLDREVFEIRAEFGEINVRSLEIIAKERYGVKAVVDTPLALWNSYVVDTWNGLYIFYNAPFERYKPLALGHEIGHIAAGHFDGNASGILEEEDEADYFSAKINNVSLNELRFCRWVDSTLFFKDLVLYPFRKKKEVKRLQGMGVYYYMD